jgi:hypothetical protein
MALVCFGLYNWFNHAYFDLLWKEFWMSNLRSSMCTIIAGKRTEFLISIEVATLELVVVLGAMLGGFVAVNFMSDPSNVSKPKKHSNLQYMV